MEIKGIAIKAIKGFMLRKFQTRYDGWINLLSDKSKVIFSGTMLVGKWYPFHEAFVEPLEKACQLSLDNKKELPWKCGRFIAESNINEIYKVFLKIGSPAFTISRAPAIFDRYFRPVKMKIIENSPHKAVLHILVFPQACEMVEFTAAGWMERTLEMIGCRRPEVKISQSLARGSKVTEFILQWK